jgi:competence ComEA-like helix-hairpin-helix protein
MPEYYIPVMMRRLLFGRFVLPIVFLAVLFSPVALAGKKKPPAQPVNINTANSEQLQLVPGIGPATADKILQMRKSYGAFKSVDDLLAIRGLGPKRLEKMRKYLTVGKTSESKSKGAPLGDAGSKVPAKQSPPATQP